MKLTLVFVRHFATLCAENGIYCGNCQQSLTAAGKAAAIKAGQTFASVFWDGVYSSPQPRAQASAQLLVPHQPAQILSGMTELNYGQWEGLTREEVCQRDLKLYQCWQKKPSCLAPPDGETAKAVVARAHQALQDVYQQHVHSTSTSIFILIVTHKAVLRLLLCDFFATKLDSFRQAYAAKPGHTVIVRQNKQSEQVMLLYAGPPPSDLQQLISE